MFGLEIVLGYLASAMMGWGDFVMQIADEIPI